MVHSVNLPTKDNYEFVKCVVVGDQGVGKTCLTCAWSVGTKYTLQNLVKSHVSTVFAIDHFIRDKKVYDRSWCNVDGLPVCLQLWDTFGCHEKDRGFAYKGADVVLLCFSITKQSSLDSVLKFWMSEIKSKCSTTPVVLVGTQADMRYNCLEDSYKEMEKGLVYKTVKSDQVILPDKGRAVAKQIGAPYYETSVLTHYGVDDVFFNVIRAAMIERRKIKFWSQQLRKIQYPLIQAPITWPEKQLPIVEVPETSLNKEIADLFTNQSMGDMLVSAQDVCFVAHRLLLASSCQVMEDALLASTNRSNQQKENTPLEETNAAFSHDIDLPGFVSVELKLCKDPFNSLHGEMVTVLNLSNEITPLALQFVLEYLYTGRVKEDFDVLPEAKRAAEILQLKDLLLQISNLQSNEGFLNSELEKQFCLSRSERIKRLALWKGEFTDVKFSLDDGIVASHKPLLVARCDMMSAMFNPNFLEGTASLIPLPGVTVEVFKVLQEFLYTGCLSVVSEVDCLSMIEVANRLCLPRLVKLIENAIVQQFLSWESQKVKFLEDCILWIEPAQLHNADQLASWCISYVCQHFPEAMQKHTKFMQGLSKDNIMYIEKNRWPPAWYASECDLYNRTVNEDNKKIQRRAQFTRIERCTTVCMCFRRNSRFSFDDTEDVPG